MFILQQDQDSRRAVGRSLTGNHSRAVAAVGRG